MHISRWRICGLLHVAKVPEKSCMPRMTKTIWSTKMTPKTLPTAGIAWKSEVMISFMPALREIRRSGRSTRITRSTRSGRSCGTDSARSTTSEIITMTKSTWFHAERMYDSLPLQAKPMETILVLISQKKRTVKKRSIFLSACARSDSLSRRGESRARQIEETMMARITTWSNLGCLIAQRHSRRSGFCGPKMKSEWSAGHGFGPSSAPWPPTVSWPSEPVDRIVSDRADWRPVSGPPLRSVAAPSLRAVLGTSSSSANSVRMTATSKFMRRYLPSRTVKMKNSEQAGPRMAATGSIASIHSPVSRMKTVSMAG